MPDQCGPWEVKKRARLLVIFQGGSGPFGPDLSHFRTILFAAYGERNEFKGMKVLVTGSSGLIGSEAVEHFDRQGHEGVGVGNNMWRVFLRPTGPTLWELARTEGGTHGISTARMRVSREAVMYEL